YANLFFNDPEGAAITLSGLKASPNILSASIYKPSGEVFASYWRDHNTGAWPTRWIAGPSEAHWFTSRELTLVRQMLIKDKWYGTIYIRSDLEEQNNLLRRNVGTVSIVLLISLMAAFVLSSVFQKATARPIVQLAEIAQMVSREKNYSVRAPMSRN